ncbi:hypothetical protein C8Q79DRAFT_524935 [Trametes meyenii]|nr:hypothetical protein C8Q79DRAFT_524935 [Trametes meyenii]
MRRGRQAEHFLTQCSSAACTFFPLASVSAETARILDWVLLSVFVTMHTTIHFMDHCDPNKLSAVGSGIVGSSSRDASRSMNSLTTDTVWKKNPTRITMPGRGAPQGPQRRPAVANPYNRRFTDTLNSRKDPKLSVGPGNHTASRTVLSGGGAHYSPEGYPTVSRQNNNKRPKLDLNAGPALTSSYFSHGDSGTGKNKGKGRAPHAAVDAIVVSDDEEDTGTLVPQPASPASNEKKKDPTPDPLDCISSASGSPTVPYVQREVHDFERPSPPPSIDRLPPDGPSTSRLRAQHAAHSEREYVDVDALGDRSDEIQSASEFDLEDGFLHHIASPYGREQIPKGGVKQKIETYEKRAPPPPSRRPPPNKLPMIDLKQRSVKSAMKPKSNKAVHTPAQFNRQPVSESLDVEMTQPSGFGKTARKPNTTKVSGPMTLPLLAVSLGCQSLLDEGSPDRLWLRTEFSETDQTYLLKIVRSPSGSELVREFNISRDFNAFKHTSADVDWLKDVSIIVQFQTTSPGGKPKPGLFQPGNTRFPGQVTFKFAPNEKGWIPEVYAELITCLRKYIEKRELMKPPAPAKCWEAVMIAQQHKEKELERTANSPRRYTGTITGVFSASTGPSDAPSKIALAGGEETTVSAPPNTERRATRQSTRSARASLTPENLEEL